MLVDSRTDLEMCLVAVSEKPFCLRLSLTETKRVDGVFFKGTTFVSPVPDPRAYAADTMSLSWEGMFAYAVDAMSLSWEGTRRIWN
jgi:hypothetical protein